MASFLVFVKDSFPEAAEATDIRKEDYSGYVPDLMNFAMVFTAGQMNKVVQVLQSHTGLLLQIRDNTNAILDNTNIIREDTKVIRENTNVIREDTKVIRENTNILSNHTEMLKQISNNTEEIAQNLRENQLADIRSDIKARIGMS